QRVHGGRAVRVVQQGERGGGVRHAQIVGARRRRLGFGDLMSTPRKLYLFAAVVLALGAIGAIVKGDFLAIAVFTTASALMFWNASRVDMLIARAEQRKAELDAERAAADPLDPRAGRSGRRR